MQSYLLDLAVRSIVASDRIEGRAHHRQLISEGTTLRRQRGPRAKRAVEFVNLLYNGGQCRPTLTVEQVRSLYDTLLGAPRGRRPPRRGSISPNPVVIHDNTPRKSPRAPDSEAATIIANVQVALNHALNPNVPALFSAIATHFMVGVTHPFYDGSGRLGQVPAGGLPGADAHPADDPHPPSTLNIQKSRYYKAFSAAGRTPQLR